MFLSLSILSVSPSIGCLIRVPSCMRTSMALSLYLNLSISLGEHFTLTNDDVPTDEVIFHYGVVLMCNLRCFLVEKTAVNELAFLIDTHDFIRTDTDNFNVSLDISLHLFQRERRTVLGLNIPDKPKIRNVFSDHSHYCLSSNKNHSVAKEPLPHGYIRPRGTANGLHIT